MPKQNCIFKCPSLEIFLVMPVVLVFYLFVNPMSCHVRRGTVDSWETSFTPSIVRNWIGCDAFRFLGEVNASTFGYPRSRFERCTSAGQDSHMHSFIQLKEARSLATLCLPENLTIHAHLGMKQCQKFDCDFICRETCAHKVQIIVRKTKAQHTRVG